MPHSLDIVRQILESYAGQQLPSKVELRQILEQINHLPDTEIEAIYAEIGGQSPPSTIGSTSIQQLPYPVAYLLCLTNTQRNDLVRLLFLFETIECYVRWRVAQVLSVVHHERNFVIPDAILSGYSQKALRPSMGIWVGMLKQIGKQIQEDEHLWGVDSTRFAIEIGLLNDITAIRNSIAHGNVTGDVAEEVNGEESTLDKSIRLANNVLQMYAELGIQHFINREATIERPNQHSFTANGPTIQACANISLEVQGSNRLDARDSYYTFCKSNEHPMLQTPCTFLIVEASPNRLVTDATPHANFSTATFISTHGECKNATAGGHLVYSLIERSDKEDVYDLEDFVRLFKTDVVTLSKEHWNGLLDEITDSSAWAKDRKLLKKCRGLNASLTKEKGQLWYFGGNPQTGKSTLLFSYLSNQRNGNSYVFPYRFTMEENSVDKFLIGFREAIIYWLQERTEVPLPDASLTGADLEQDVDRLLEKLMTFLSDNKSPKNELFIGLDNLECLYDHHNEEQPVLERLLNIIDSWKRFFYTRIEMRNNQEHRSVRRQIFVLGTAMNINTVAQDIDDFFHMDSRVSFVYALAHLPPLPNPQRVLEHHSSREREMHQHITNPQGAHMPPIGQYGTIQIMTERSRNPGFGSFVKDPHPIGIGHRFITDLLNISGHNPVIIDAVAENLHGGVISINDPVTTDSYNAIQKNGSPYLQNRAVLIPMLLCFMNELQKPLTVSSLQLLCSVNNFPTPSENNFISDVLYEIPQYVEKLALPESNSDGTVAFGWRLRNSLAPQDLNNLLFVVALVQLRIQQLIDRASELPDSLQLKSVFIERGDIAAPSTATALVPALFNDLRGTLAKDIQEILTKHSTVPELQRSANMLYQTANVSPANITWLQKASESYTYSRQTDQYVQSQTFGGFWLKHINAEPTPLFDHEIQVVGYPEKLEKTLFINDDYYIAIGASFNSVSIYSKDRSQPDVVILAFDSPEKSADCTLISFENDIACIAVAIDQTAHLYAIEVTDRARVIHHVTHDYQASITGFFLDGSALGIFGARKDNTDDGEQWAIDILLPTMGDELTCTASILHVSGSTANTHAPRHAGSTETHTWITYNNTICLVNSTSASERYALGFVPPANKSPIPLTEGVLCLSAGNNANTQTAWFHSGHQAKQRLLDSSGSHQFNKIIFAEELSDQRILTLDYKSTIRVYEWGTEPPLCEVECHAPNMDAVYARTIKGALLKDNRLMLYGDRRFMAFYDLKNVFSGTHKSGTPLKPYHHSTCHYGGISGAMTLNQSFNDHNDIFLTWSEDNDLRLWSWTAGQNDTAECLGLFRGHEDKIKSVEVIDKTIISTDIKQNIRTWHLNNGCNDQLINQRSLTRSLKPTPEPSQPQEAQVSLEHCPSFINKGMLFDKTLWTVTTVESSVSLEAYPQHGRNWSQRRARTKQQSPQLTESKGLKKSIQFAQYILLLFNDKSIVIFDTVTQVFMNHAELGTLSVSNWELHSAGLLLWTKKSIFRLDTSLTLTKLIQAEELEEISIAHADSTRLVYATRASETYVNNRGATRVRKTNSSHIYKANTDGSSLQRIDTREIGNISFKGIYHNNGLLMYWIYRANEPLELYWYNDSTQYAAKVPKHPLLIGGPQTIYRLPNEEGFSFKSGDNDKRWVLKFDYPLIEEDPVPPVPKKLLLTQHIDLAYTTKHLPEMLEALDSKLSVLQDVYAARASFGVVVYYRNGHKTGKLLWTGSSIRDFHVIAITPSGLVLLNKNRSIIVLQLMNGNHPVSFEELTRG